MYNVRVAKVEDYQVVRVMAQKFYATTTQAKKIPWDEETAQLYFCDMLACGFCLLAYKDSEPVGMLGCMVTPALLNKNYKIATEIFWWVEPEARNSRVGIQLLKGAEELARYVQCALLVMGTLDNSPAELGAVYEHLGYKCQETSWVKEL